MSRLLHWGDVNDLSSQKKFFFVGQSDSSVDSDASNDSFDGDASDIESETDEEVGSGADTCSLSNRLSPSASNSSPCANQRSVLAQAWSSVEYS